MSGKVTAQVSVLKGLTLDGPILFPVKEDLPFLAQPLTPKEKLLAMSMAEKYGTPVEDSLPISIVGSGPDINQVSCFIHGALPLTKLELGRSSPPSQPIEHYSVVV